MTKKLLLCAVSFLGLVSNNAFAEENSVSEANIGLETVIVTAQKRETKLQKTPISISVLSSLNLEDRHVKTLEDLMNGGTPSLRVAPFFSRSSALTVGIRGMVPFDANQPSRDATVGVYIDGVYLGRSQGLGAALFDIQRIEVLKGPQGTLFGRNTEGGAVSIVTRKPSGKLRASQTIGVSNFDGRIVETHFDLPEIANLSFKFDAVSSKRGGTVKNTLSGYEDFNQFDKKGIHTAILWKPNDKFDAQWDFDSSSDKTTPYYVQLVEKNPAAAALAPLVKLQEKRTDIVDLGVIQENSIGHTQGHMLHMNWHVSENTEVRAISSFRKVSQSQLDNSIGAHSGPFRANAQFSRYSLASLRQHQYSHELQLLGNYGNLSYVAGVYYFNEEGDDDAWTPNTAKWNNDGTAYTILQSLSEGAAWVFPDRASTAFATSQAIFGQFTYTPEALANKLHITLGARYTKDKKHGVLTKVNGANTNFTFNISSDRTDPLVTIAYDLNDNTHLYAKWGTGYRAGGANSRSVNYRAFGPETVATTEFGLKSEFFANRLRVNLASYETDYENIQIDFSATNLLNSNRGTLETVNALGKGKIDGIEADINVALFDGLTASISYALTNSDLPKAANPFANNALVNVFTVYTPENATSVSLDYERKIKSMSFRAHLDANIADGYHSSSSENTFTDDSFVVNGRMVLSDIELNEKARMQVSLWSRNLLNEEHTFYKSRGAYSVLGSFGMYNEPRTYGLDLNFKY